jgi:hypothetical protein
MDFNNILSSTDLEFLELSVLGIDKTKTNLSYREALVYNHKKKQHMINTELRRSKKIIFHDKNVLNYIKNNILPKINIDNSILMLDESHYDLLKYDIGDFFGKHSDFQVYNAPYVSLHTLILSLNDCTGGETCIYNGTEKTTLRGSTVRGGGIFFPANLPHESLKVKSEYKLVLKFDVYVIDKILFETNSFVTINTSDNNQYYIPFEWLDIFPESILNYTKDCSDTKIDINLTTDEFDIVYKYFLRKLSQDEMKKLLPLSNYFGLREIKSNSLLDLSEIKVWNKFLQSKHGLFITDNHNFYNAVKEPNLIRFVCIQEKKIINDKLEESFVTIYLQNGFKWIDTQYNLDFLNYGSKKYNILSEYLSRINKEHSNNTILQLPLTYKEAVTIITQIHEKTKDQIIISFKKFKGNGDFHNTKTIKEYVPYNEWCNSDYTTEYEAEYNMYKMNLLFGFYKKEI